MKHPLIRSLVCVVALLAGGATAARAQTAACATLPPATSITHVGEFTNLRYTVAHAYGFTVMLWRAGDCLIGVFASSAGLASDTPIGVIQDVQYDRLKSSPPRALVGLRSAFVSFVSPS